jgi:hypothetical protein
MDNVEHMEGGRPKYARQKMKNIHNDINKNMRDMGAMHTSLMKKYVSMILSKPWAKLSKAGKPSFNIKTMVLTHIFYARSWAK